MCEVSELKWNEKTTHRERCPGKGCQSAGCWSPSRESKEGIHAEVVDGTQQKVYLSFASLLQEEKGTDKFGKGEKQNNVILN